MNISSRFFKVSVDKGVTFKDSVVYEKNLDLLSGKALTCHEDACKDVKEINSSSFSNKNFTFSELIKNIKTFIYRTSRVTNVIVRNKTTKTAFIMNEVFKDSLVLKEGKQLRTHDFSIKYPESFTPKKFTFEINERISLEGKVIRSLDQKITKIIKKNIYLGFESIYVSFLWFIANPIHEIKTSKIISKINSEITISLNYKLFPIIREYQRASTTSIDDSLKPIIQNCLKDLKKNPRKFQSEF